MKDKNAIIRLNEVWKTYRMGDVDVNALRGLNLNIKKGEFVAVMGPSGSGKSTAVNMIGCLDIPSKGEIYLEGQNISEMTESELAQIRGRKIGFIFQTFNLIGTLSALENVTLPMIFQQKTQAERIERGKELLKLVELEDRMDHKPNQLSGGQRQRVAIARALANDPDVLLADEPTGNLDSKTGKVVLEMLKRLNKEKKKTIIMVTHDDELCHYAQRIVHLKDGQIKLKKTANRGG